VASSELSIIACDVIDHFTRREPVQCAEIDHAINRNFYVRDGRGQMVILIRSTTSDCDPIRFNKR
jgi:hypothetical protein